MAIDKQAYNGPGYTFNGPKSKGFGEGPMTESMRGQPGYGFRGAQGKGIGEDQVMATSPRGVYGYGFRGSKGSAPVQAFANAASNGIASNSPAPDDSYGDDIANRIKQRRVAWQKGILAQPTLQEQPIAPVNQNPGLFDMLGDYFMNATADPDKLTNFFQMGDRFFGSRK